MDLPCMEFTQCSGVNPLPLLLPSLWWADKSSSDAEYQRWNTAGGFLTEGFGVFTHYWNTSWGSRGNGGDQGKSAAEPSQCAGALSRSEHGAKVVGSTPIWAIHLRAVLDPCGFLPTQNILWICEQKAQPISHWANLTGNHPGTPESSAKGRQRFNSPVNAGKLLVQAQISSLP